MELSISMVLKSEQVSQDFFMSERIHKGKISKLSFLGAGKSSKANEGVDKNNELARSLQSH